MPAAAKTEKEDAAKTANFDNDDQFEDFVVHDWKESEAELKKLPLWEDTWEGTHPCSNNIR
jgi:hypothetical protein